MSKYITFKKAKVRLVDVYYMHEPVLTYGLLGVTELLQELFPRYAHLQSIHLTFQATQKNILPGTTM